MSKYSELKNHYIFFPIAVETLAPFGSLGLDFVKASDEKTPAETDGIRPTSFLTQLRKGETHHFYFCARLGHLFITPKYNSSLKEKRKDHIQKQISPRLKSLT